MLWLWTVSAGSLLAMKDENCSPLKLIVSYPSQFCHVCEFFLILSRFITVVFCIFQYSIWKWINCSHFFFLPPFIHFPVFTFDLFPNQLSFCHQIYFTRKAQCVVFPEVFLFKVCLFLLTWHHAWGKFFGPTFFASELCFTFLH